MDPIADSIFLNNRGCAVDFRQIEGFVRVAELGSFTKAAQLLGTTQPALSRLVRMLEVDLRQNLLVRNGRGAVPTEAGLRLLDHGRGILHQVARAREDMASSRGGLAGRVAIGLPPSLARVLTVPLTRAFRAQMPEARLSISEGLSAQMQSWLTEGRLDLAVLYNASPTADLDISPLGEEELFLVQRRQPGLSEDPPPGPLRLREVAALPLVMPTRPNAVRQQLEAEVAALGCRLTVALEIDGVQAILDLVADGLGAALLPRNAVDSCVRPSAYQLRPVVEPALRTRLCLAVSSLRPTTLTQLTTAELIRQTLRARVLG